MSLTLIVSVAVGVLTGAIATLKFIAPKTKNTTDDAVLKRLEALEALADKLK